MLVMAEPAIVTILAVLAVLAVAAMVVAALAVMMMVVVVVRFHVQHRMAYGSYNADRRKVEQDR